MTNPEVSSNFKDQEGKLFDINMETLETLLINENLIEKPSKQFRDMFNLEWDKNIPNILWKSSQKSLVYLFYTINNNTNNIHGGSIIELLSKTFLLKGEILSDKKISNSLRYIYHRYIKDGYQKTEDMLRIDKILQQL